MPKFHQEYQQFVKKAGQKREEIVPRLSSRLSALEIKNLAKSYRLKKLGSGAELSVFALPNSEYAIAVSHCIGETSPLTAKKRFYISRILSILFPYNFPKVYTSFGSHPDPQDRKMSGSLRQRIQGPHVDPYRQKDGFFTLIKTALAPRQRVRFPFREAHKNLAMMGITISDLYPDNFVLGKDGGEYYVDSVGSLPRSYPGTHSWDHKAILQYMEENDYGIEDIRRVSNALTRICELDEEYKRQQKEKP